MIRQIKSIILCFCHVALLPCLFAKVWVTPGKPEDIQVKASEYQKISFSWKKVDSAATIYRFERRSSIDDPYLWVADVPARKRHFTDEGEAFNPLLHDTLYEYQISVFNKNKDQSPFVHLQCRTIPAPEPPQNVVVSTQNSRRVRIVFDPSRSPEVKSYRIERATQDTLDKPALVGELHLKKIGREQLEWIDGKHASYPLMDSTDYYYRVSSVNQSDQAGTPSEWCMVRTMPPPAVIVTLRARSDQVRIVPLKWGMNLESDIKEYHIYRALDPAGPYELIGKTVGRENTAYIDGGKEPGDLKDDTEYFYKIKAVNDVGAQSAFSDMASARTRNVPPPVSGVTTVSGEPNRVTVRWHVSSDEKVTGYAIHRADGFHQEFKWLADVKGRDTTEFVDEGNRTALWKDRELVPGVEYRYKVFAFNAAKARSTDAEYVTGSPKSPPRAPSGLQSVATEAQMIEVIWYPNPEKDIREYWVEVSVHGSGRFKKFGVVPHSSENKLSVKEFHLPPGTKKDFRIKAIDQDGLESNWSEVLVAQVFA